MVKRSCQLTFLAVLNRPGYPDLVLLRGEADPIVTSLRPRPPEQVG
jgi:hypothetical protein